MTDMEKITALKRFSDDDLKAELKRRQTVERARRHITSAEEALKRAKDKYDLYVRTLRMEDELAKKASRRV